MIVFSFVLVIAMLKDGISGIETFSLILRKFSNLVELFVLDPSIFSLTDSFLLVLSLYELSFVIVPVFDVLLDE